MGISFAEAHPELVHEWSLRNSPLTADQVTSGSNKRYWWQGSCGHEWISSPKARSAGEKCPYCAGKRVLKGFNDLMTIASDIAEEWSDKNQDISPSEVLAGSHKKAWWRGRCGHEWQAEIRNRVKGAGCPYCSSNRILPGFNDLATIRPELVEEWSDQNLPLQPTDVTAHVNRKVWWKCRTCGNEWETLISTRSDGSLCPYCSGLKLLPGFNDFATTNPELAREWSSRNGGLKPGMINELSRRNVWWRCRTCGHEWQSVVYSRVNGSCCPVCEGREVRKGYNDLLTTDPELCEEWAYELNGELRPDRIQRTSLRMVWWKGRCGHAWRGKIADRVFHGQGCTKCDREFHDMLPFLALYYYARAHGVQMTMGEQRVIGVPLDVYFPEFHAAIMFSRRTHYSQEGQGAERVKDYLCQRNRIKLVRILNAGDPKSEYCTCIYRQDESDAALEAALKKAFHTLGIHLEMDIDEDRDILYDYFRKWKGRQP